MHTCLSDLQGGQLSELLDDSEAGRILDVRQTARRLAMSPGEVRRCAAEGIIPAEKLGTGFAFDARRVLNWVLRGLVQLREAGERKDLSPEDQKQRERFANAFGDVGRLWFDEGLSFQEARAEFRAEHLEEFNRLRVKLGSNVAAWFKITGRHRRK